MPGAVQYEPLEIWRLLRARVALLLHIRPDEVDEMDIADVYDVLEIHAAQIEIENHLNRRK